MDLDEQDSVVILLVVFFVVRISKNPERLHSSTSTESWLLLPKWMYRCTSTAVWTKGSGHERCAWLWRSLVPKWKRNTLVRKTTDVELYWNWKMWGYFVNGWVNNRWFLARWILFSPSMVFFSQDWFSKTNVLHYQYQFLNLIYHLPETSTQIYANS